MSVSKNSDFFVTCFFAPAKQAYMPSMAISASYPAYRKHRTDDCMDAAVRRSEDRTMHGAIVENRSVRVVHEDRPGGVPPGWRTSTELTPQSWKKCILRDVTC